MFKEWQYSKPSIYQTNWGGVFGVIYKNMLLPKFGKRAKIYGEFVISEILFIIMNNSRTICDQTWVVFMNNHCKGDWKYYFSWWNSWLTCVVKQLKTTGTSRVQHVAHCSDWLSVRQRKNSAGLWDFLTSNVKYSKDGQSLCSQRSFPLLWEWLMAITYGSGTAQ